RCCRKAFSSGAASRWGVLSSPGAATCTSIAPSDGRGGGGGAGISLRWQSTASSVQASARADAAPADAPRRRRVTRLARARAPAGRAAREDGVVALRRAGAGREGDRVGMRAPQEGEIDDAPNHLIIPEPGGARGPCEPCPLRQVTVRVHVD